jgi:hypothetical protein
MDSRDVQGPAVLARLQGYEAAAATLMRMAFVAGCWSEGEQLTPWTRAMARLTTRRSSGGVVLWLDLQRYPATLLLYCFGLGAVFAKRWHGLGAMLHVRVENQGREDRRAVEAAPVWALLEQGADVMKILPGMDRKRTPLQAHLEALLYPMFKSSFASEEAFHLTFDFLEVLAALCYAAPGVEKAASRYWALPGSYGWRASNRQRILDEIRDNLNSMGNASPFVTTGLAGRTVTVASTNVDELEKFTATLGWW